jgi:hypothetical protein
MGQLVLLAVPVLQLDKDAQIMGSRRHSYACSSELCTDLVVSSGDNALLGAVDIESGDGRVVGGLFREVRNLDFIFAGGTSCTARWGTVRVVFDRWGGVLDYPVALIRVREQTLSISRSHTLKNSPSVELYGLQGLPLTYFCPKIRL